MRFDRRELLRGAALAGGGTALSSTWPAWALSVAPGTIAPIPEFSGEDITLRIARQTVTVDRRDRPAIGINGTVPAPLLRLREGQKVRLHVRNDLDEEAEAYYDQRITRRLILRPPVELNFAAQDVRENRLSSDLSDVELG